MEEYEPNCMSVGGGYVWKKLKPAEREKVWEILVTEVFPRGVRGGANRKMTEKNITEWLRKDAEHLGRSRVMAVVKDVSGVKDGLEWLARA